MAKYYSGEAVLTEYKASPNVTLYCWKCDQAIQDGAPVVNRDVHKCGDYDYTETVHQACYTGPEAVAPEAIVMGGTSCHGVLIDGMTVEQWLAARTQGKSGTCWYCGGEVPCDACKDPDLSKGGL